MILLDGSVLIGHFEPADAHHAQATAVLTAHLTDSFAASVITLAAVYTGAARSGQAQRLNELLQHLRIEELDLPAGAALRLGELRAATNLKPSPNSPTAWNPATKNKSCLQSNSFSTAGLTAPASSSV